MPTRTPMHRPPGVSLFAERRPSAAKRGYGRKWQAARAGFLKRHPWCVRCAAKGLQVRAMQVDHSVPHRGDMKLFWDSSKWQGLCDPCSNAKSRSEMLTTPLRG